MEENNIVVVASYNSIDEAHIFKALLESAGIQTRLKNDITAQVLPVYGGMMEVNLLVSAGDEARAREILAAGFDKGRFEQDAESAQCDTEV